MLLCILLFFFLGLSLGMVTGLVPGLHPNTLLVAFSGLVFSGTMGFHCMLAFVVSLSVTNTIANFIPSIYLGAPDPGTALSVLPGHRLLLEGRGDEALFLTVTGGLAVMSFTFIAIPFLLWFIPLIYGYVNIYMHWLLLLTLALLLKDEKGAKKIYSLFMFLVSGAAGVLLLSGLPTTQAVFPSLTGLFGISFILGSIAGRTEIPQQKKGKHRTGRWLRGSAAGWLAGLFVGVLPGIGAAQAGVLAGRFTKGDTRDFLVSLGGINTTTIVISFIMLYSMSKTRSGAALAVSQAASGFGLPELLLVVFVGLLSCFASAPITLAAGRLFSSALLRISYRKTSAVVLAFILATVFAFSGPVGLFVSLMTSIIGLCCARLGVKRMYLMGVLMLPTMLHFSGLSPLLLVSLGL